MATIHSYTTIEQSRKLAEILPLESADMYYDRGGLPSLIDKYVTHESIKNNKYQHLIPCWSLSALFSVLPKIQGGKPIIALDDNYITYPHMSDLHTKADEPVDACVAMIEKLKELNLL